MILNRQRAVRVSAEGLRGFLSRVRRVLKLPGDSVTVCLVESRKMARLNSTYRGKQGATDVLSFPANGHKSAGLATNRHNRFLGDIAIAPAVARRNAAEFGRTTHEELEILILHGVLHLMGHDHETDNGEMERYESRLRRKLGLER